MNLKNTIFLLSLGEEARISNFRLLKDCTVVLESRNLTRESDSILQVTRYVYIT